MTSHPDCDNCSRPADWEYAPIGNERYYCDYCIPRGCSCQAVDYDNPNGEQHRDEQNRLLPCVEYEWIGDEWREND